VAGAGDVNGDGKADFIVGAAGVDSAGFFDVGSVYVYSGATGTLLFQKNGAAAYDNFGHSVAGAGDVDGNGRSDFIIGAPSNNSAFADEAGSAYVYSGATGALLFQKNGAAGDLLGNSVAGGGDVNGDGRADFIVGAFFADPGGLVDAGSAFIYSLPCAATKGDMNGDSTFTATDVMLMLDCVFLGTGLCGPCFADVNCDGVLTSADIVLELNKVFLDTPFPCS
jgi:hypothetical protein